jgi:hypothetical protein
MWFLYYGPLILFFIEIWSTDQLDYSEKYTFFCRICRQIILKPIAARMCRISVTVFNLTACIFKISEQSSWK